MKLETDATEPKGIRAPVVIAVAVILTAAVALVVMSRKDRPDQIANAGPATTNASHSSAQAPGPVRTTSASRPSTVGNTLAPNPVASVQPHTAPGIAQPPATGAAPPRYVTPEVTQLMATLTNINQRGMSLTEERVVQWQEALKQLAAQGTAAIPGIMNFLDQNVDIDFSAVPNGEKVLGASSLRAALLETLGGLGGAEAQLAALQVLQTTGSPREIALVAHLLEQNAPQQYRDQILAAAHDAINQAGPKSSNPDLWPVFKVLSEYGQADSVTALQQAAAGRDYNYALIGLAQMPEDAGVPALIQMANSQTGPRTRALELLSQTAAHNESARATLLEQARQQTIPAGTWRRIAWYLQGYESVLGNPDLAGRPDRFWSGNQGQYSVAATYTPAEVAQNLALIEQLRQYCTDPLAVSRLDEAKAKMQAAQQADSPK